MQRIWFLRLLNFGLFAALSASAVFWGLKIWAASQPVVPVQPVQTDAAVRVVDTSAVAKALGQSLGDAPAASKESLAPSRFQLKGVVASAHGGAALIAIDGQNAKPYQVGDNVESGYRVLALGLRSAVLGAGNGASSMTLDMPDWIASAKSGAAPGATSAPPDGVPPIPGGTGPAPR